MPSKVPIQVPVEKCIDVPKQACVKVSEQIPKEVCADDEYAPIQLIVNPNK